VLARLRGLLRRAETARAHYDRELAVADLTMNEDALEVRRAGKLIELTATEFELLRFPVRNPRRVLSKAQILDRSGTTTSAARDTSSSCTSATCARRSTPAASR
jgi:two-component system OmpR family response regulator